MGVDREILLQNFKNGCGWKSVLVQLEKRAPNGKCTTTVQKMGPVMIWKVALQFQKWTWWEKCTSTVNEKGAE